MSQSADFQILITTARFHEKGLLRKCKQLTVIKNVRGSALLRLRVWDLPPEVRHHRRDPRAHPHRDRYHPQHRQVRQVHRGSG